jgi:hypothetical protein
MDSSPLKGKSGAHLTQGLFYEFQNKDAPFSLREEDFTSRAGKTYKSIYKMYMDATDEHEAAMTILGSLNHWRKLCATEWFMEGKVIGTGDNTYRLSGLRQWRLDMKARDESMSKKLLMKEAEGGSVAAMRYLNEVSRKSVSGAGRPEKKLPTKTSAVTSIQDAYKKVK